MEFRTAKPGMCVAALAATLGKAGELPDRVGLRFEYSSGGGGLPLSATVSAGRGWAAPYIRYTPSRDGGQWRTAKAVADLDGFPADRDVVVQLWVVGEAGAGQWARVRNLSLMAEPLPDVSARLDSPGGKVIFSENPDARMTLGLRSLGGKRNFTATVRDAQGEVRVKAETEVAGQEKLEVGTSPLPPGGYTVDVLAVPGEKAFRFPVRKVPARAGQVVIENGVPVVDGKPFFMIGLYHVGDPVAEIINRENERQGRSQRLTRKKMLSGVKTRRFNTVLYPWGLAPLDFYKDARAAGLMVVSGSARTDPAKAAALAEKAPAVFGFYGVDEPTASDVGRVAAIYREYKEKNPWNPVMTAIDNGCVGFGPDRFVDVAMPDCYPLSGPGSDVSDTALFVRNCRRVLFKNDPTATVIAVPQLFTLDNERWKGVHPTCEQVRAQVFAALAAGAKGIMYYAYYTHEPLAQGMPGNPDRKHWFLPESPLWDGIQALNKEIAKLAPILLDTPEPRTARTLDDKLITGLFRSRGKTYLLAVNPLGRPRKGRRITLPMPVRSAFPVVGSPLARVKGDDLFIDFPPYGAGAWRLEKTGGAF